MNKSGVLSGHGGLKIAVLLLLSVTVFTAARGQGKEYNFNTPGSECFFRYLCFSADSNYSITRRPYMFVLGDEYVSARDTYIADTMRLSDRFRDFLFIYIPGRGNTSFEKLGCVRAIVDFFTAGIRYEKNKRVNVFFQVNDTAITRSDINNLGLKTIFSGIRLGGEKHGLTGDLMSEFTAETIDYSKYDKPVVDYATYYVDDTGTKNEEADTSSKEIVKTYFGPPSKFKYTLSGSVHDQLTGEALPFVAIQVRGTNIGTTTTADGLFSLVNVPSDTSTLLVQYVGYGTTKVFLDPGLPGNNFRIDIKPASQTLQEIKVTAYRDDVVFAKKAEVSTIKITPLKISQLPSIGEHDVMRSFQLMPGVSASNESSSGLYVRGGTPDQNLVLYDGFTVYHVDHLYGFFSAFNSNAVKDIQLYKGGFESRFGGRISSVTEITSKEGNQKRINFGTDVSLLSTNVFLEIPVGEKFSSFVAFRKSYQGALYDMIFKKFNNSRTINSPDVGNGPGRRFSQSSQITSYFYDLNGKFTYKPTEKDIISLSFFNGTDKLDNSFSSNIPSFGQMNANFSMNSVDLTRYGNIGSSLKWARKWGSRLYGNTILSYSNYYNFRNRSQDRMLVDPDNNSTTSRSGIFEDNDLRDYSIKSDYQLELSAFSQIKFGIFSTLYDINYSYAQSDTIDILNRDGSALLGGAYVQAGFKFLDGRLQLIPGLRADYFEATGKPYLEPRFSLSYSLTDRIMLKAATGKYYQFANRVTREDIMSGSKEFWILSDGNTVPTTSSVHLVGGISYESENYTLSAETYYKKISDLTEYSLRVNASPFGVDYNENFFNGSGYARGVELLAQKNSGNLTGWLSYTLGEARNKFAAYSDVYYPANQDVTHEFKIVGMYKFR
ncbi:MAG: TonB-dependent receptor, partial [Bacteroidales bacterium]